MKTHDVLYEWMDIQFGLCNGPNNFLSLMNHVFKRFIGKFIVVDFHDILIYKKIKNKKQRLNHLREVFNTLREQKLYANMKKTSNF